MKRNLIRISCYSLLILIVGCFLKTPSATMTFDYLEVVRPGEDFAVVELKDVKLDSVLGYPIEETPVLSFTPVKRKNHTEIDKNASVKIKFTEKYQKYCWRVIPDPFLSDYYFVDTIKIKPNVWYRLTTDRFHFDVYFFFDNVKQISITKYKPFPGAW